MLRIGEDRASFVEHNIRFSVFEFSYSRIQRTHLRVSSNLKADLSVNSVSKNGLAEVALKLTLKYGKNLSVYFSHLTVIYLPVYFNLLYVKPVL